MGNTKINVLYYPDMYVAETTLKKALLLFDELHFMDRPSFTFKNFGTIGAPSPLRQYERSFRESNVPLIVHGVQGGRVEGDFLERVKADINDPLFLKQFKSGLEISPAFRNIQIPPGNYGRAGNENDVVHKMIGTDISFITETHGSAENLLFDDNIKHFDLSSPLGCAKHLISMVAICSAKLNFALTEGARNGFFPLADATPYANLLGAQYIRAINKLEFVNKHLLISDLSFAIINELLPNECVANLSLEKVVEYRKKTEKARKEFLEYLALLQIQQPIGPDGDYVSTIEKLIKMEIIPAAKSFRNKLQTVKETFTWALAKSALGWLSSSSVISVFTDLSWEKIIPLSCAVSLDILKKIGDKVVAERAIKRECSISYILSLDK